MNFIGIFTLIIIGWTAGAESGSWLCVHPVIAKLPPKEQILFQKGLLKTFGRIMPILMPLSLILLISYYVSFGGKSSSNGILLLAATLLQASAIATTIIFNVPVNIATGNWEDTDYSDKWKRKRKLWRFFQGYRSIGFVLVFVILVIIPLYSLVYLSTLLFGHLKIY